MAEFSVTQLDQLTQVISKLLDSKLERYLERAEVRLEQIETETMRIRSENKKLKARLCSLECFQHKNHAEIIGFSVESRIDPLEVVIRLAKAAGIDLKSDHLQSAKRTGAPRISNGMKCQDITVDFERQVNCDVFLEKVGALRKAKGGLKFSMVSTRPSSGFETAVSKPSKPQMMRF